MKNALFAFLNNPILVAATSVVVAGGLGLVLTATPAPAASVPDTGASVIAASDGHLTLAFLASGRVDNVPVKVGDPVQKGQVLAALEPGNAAGAITQARAAYAAAQASYDKLLNGASGPAVDVAKAAVATAQTSLDQTKRQQDTLVANARRKLYSDDLIATPEGDTPTGIAPIVSGAYSDERTGEYHIFFEDYNVFQNEEFSFSGLEKGKSDRSDLPEALGTRGLQIAFPDAHYLSQYSWAVEIPNTGGANYATNLNAYQSALQTRDQAVAVAEAALTQAKASLAQTVATARPEDIASAQAQVESARGSLQIAEAAYGNTVIKAPVAGVVTAVHISVGQIASANTPAIELSTEN
jgi:HlyD family secretion protein